MSRLPHTAVIIFLALARYTPGAGAVMHSLTLLIHTAATLFLTGVIWFVQVVHYPLLAESRPTGGHWHHVWRTTLLVVPVMAVEGAAAVLLTCYATSYGGGRVLTCVGLLFAGVNWLSTAAVQVPAHRRLMERWDPQTARSLVRTNWLRTAAWTLRSALALCLLAEARSPGGP